MVCMIESPSPVLILCFWSVAGVWEYIEATRDMVRDLEKRVRLAKRNVESISNIMSQWATVPLYQRKEDKKGSLLNLEVIKIYYASSCTAFLINNLTFCAKCIVHEVIVVFFTVQVQCTV